MQQLKGSRQSTISAQERTRKEVANLASRPGTEQATGSGVLAQGLPGPIEGCPLGSARTPRQRTQYPGRDHRRGPALHHPSPVPYHHPHRPPQRPRVPCRQVPLHARRRHRYGLEDGRGRELRFLRAGHRPEADPLPHSGRSPHQCGETRRSGPRPHTPGFSSDAEVYVTVHDNGRGFDAEQVKPGNGLLCMEDYAEALSGRLDVDSTPGMGSTISVHIPVSDRIRPLAQV